MSCSSESCGGEAAVPWPWGQGIPSRQDGVQDSYWRLKAPRAGEKILPWASIRMGSVSNAMNVVVGHGD